jgi:hypothetical protein
MLPRDFATRHVIVCARILSTDVATRLCGQGPAGLFKELCQYDWPKACD